MEQIHKQHYNIEGIEFDIHIFYKKIERVDDENCIHRFFIALEKGKVMEFFDFIEQHDNGEKLKSPGNSIDEIIYCIFISSIIGQMEYSHFCLEYEFDETDPAAIEWYREGKCAYAKLERLFPDDKESFAIYEHFLDIKGQTILGTWN